MGIVRYPVLVRIWLGCSEGISLFLRSAWQETLYRGLPEEEAGIVSAMVLGEKSGLSDEVKDLYKKNGIAHILAISGVKTFSLVSPLSVGKPENWASLRLHNTEKYIIYLCEKG